MQACRWPEAFDCWRGGLAAAEVPSCRDWHAFAHVCERLGRWDEHAWVVEQAMQRFPEDDQWPLRQTYNQAMRHMQRADWPAAWVALETVRIGQSTDVEWPCATRYYRGQVRVARVIEGVSAPEERLERIARQGLFKASDLYPERAAGFIDAIEASAWRAPLRRQLASLVGDLIAVLRCHDCAVRLIHEPCLLKTVSALSEFWRCYAGQLEGLPACYLELLARLFLCHGQVDLYLEIRDRFQQVLGATAALPASVAELAWQVALANERGETPRFQALRRMATRFPDYREALLQLFGASALYHGERPVGDHPVQDQAFADYVSGRSIAIVGPADVGLLSGAEIETFDIVLRFNHRDDLAYQTDQFGMRTDVACYLADSLPEQPTESLVQALSGLAFAIVDGLSLERRAWLSGLPCTLRRRLDLWGYLENPMLFGYPWAIPRVLLDLLRFSPSRVKVFCADMSTGLGYQRGYAMAYCKGSMSGWNKFPAFTMHDPFSNFVLMQRLLSQGLFEVDEVLEAVLAMTPQAYLKRLQTVYAPFRGLPGLS